MAISTTTNKSQYTGNGSTTQFDLAVKIFGEDDVLVYIKNTTTGSSVLQAKTTNYTIDPISGDYDNGARITMLVAPTSSELITLVRSVDNTQILDLVEGGDLPSDALEDALDRAVMQIQQLDSQFDRTITAPDSDEETLLYELDTAETRANKALGFDADGNVTSISLVESGTVGVDSEKGLSIVGNVISAEVDDTSVEFNGSYKISVKDNGVTTAKIADANVTTAKIADANVTTAKINDLGVTTAKINDLAVTAAKIADANVTKSKIENIGALTILGNITGGATSPAEVPVETVITNDDTKIPTSGAVTDLVASIGSGWQTWTPQVDQGVTGISKTIEYAKFNQIGGTVTVACNLIISGIGTSGEPIFVLNLPVAPSAGAKLDQVVGSGVIKDSSGSSYCGSARIDSSSRVYLTGWSTSGFQVGDNPSFGLASGDEISFTITYESA